MILWSQYLTPYTLWKHNTIMWHVTQLIIFQDNQNNMRLVLNGKRSSTKRTKFMNVRYFFMTDIIKHRDTYVEYCPTGDIWAGILTKPLQGQAFWLTKEMHLFLKAHDKQERSWEAKKALDINHLCQMPIEKSLISEEVVEHTTKVYLESIELKVNYRQ